MKIKKANLEFYVITWDCNKRKVKRFNIFNSVGPLSTGRKQSTWAGDIANAIKKGTVSNRAELKKWLEGWFRNRYWSRCQYEITVSAWPAVDENEKIDVFYQLEKNLDLITDSVIQRMELNLN